MATHLNIRSKKIMKCLLVTNATDEELETLVDFIGDNCNFIIDIAFGNGKLSGNTYHALDELNIDLNSYPNRRIWQRFGPLFPSSLS